jgi:hypothetical protein
MFTPIMRRVWAAIATAVAIIVVFTVLAVAHRTPTASATGTSTGHVVWVRSDDGGLVPVTVGPGGAHATTQTSPAAGGSAATNGAQLTAVKTASHPTTHTS